MSSTRKNLLEIVIRKSPKIKVNVPLFSILPHRQLIVDQFQVNQQHPIIAAKNSSLNKNVKKNIYRRLPETTPDGIPSSYKSKLRVNTIKKKKY